MANPLIVIRFAALHVGFYLLMGLGSMLPDRLYAAECSVLEFLEKKSSAAQVLVNPCLDEQWVGVGSVFRLLPEGRLWLKSKALDSASDYQLICRNRSLKTSNISVTRADYPWIQPRGFAQCSGWIENKLTCKDLADGSDLFFCAAAITKKPEVLREIQRKTSVTMRGLAEQGHLDALNEVATGEIDQLADFIKSEIDLCRQVYQNRQIVTLAWTVQASGRVTDPVIKEPDTDPGFAACIVDVINNFDYPAFPKDVQVLYQF